MTINRIGNDHIGHAILARELSLLVAPIKSRQDLIDHLECHRGAETQFDTLSPRARQRFLDSLHFGTNGPASFSRTEIESQLNPTEAYRLLALFGAQHIVLQITEIRGGGASDATIIKFREYVIEEPGAMFDYRCNAVLQVCEPQAGSICIADLY